ncbi:MAG TPA: ADP-ribosylation family protein, partial [Gemmataceae bacterium]
LAGRFDGRAPRFSLLLHWRYYLDPPEYFTVLAGDVDGLHWGYYLDDPAHASGCIASYFASDAFELSADGDTLFEAVRLHLEMLARDYEEYRDEDPDNAADYQEDLRQLDAFRVLLQGHTGADRLETGDEYYVKYAGRVARKRHVAAATHEGMGIVVHPELYRSLSLPDKKLWSALRQKKDASNLIEKARQALREGFPGTALKLGKDLWAVGGERHTEYAYELLDAAYAALGRDVLRDVLRVHRENRDLPSVDILENE